MSSKVDVDKDDTDCTLDLLMLRADSLATALQPVLDIDPHTLVAYVLSCGVRIQSCTRLGDTLQGVSASIAIASIAPALRQCSLPGHSILEPVIGVHPALQPMFTCVDE